MQLIGLCGGGGAGKDTVADYFVKHYGYTKLSFGDELKEVCAQVFDVDINIFYDRAIKDADFEEPIYIEVKHINLLIDILQKYPHNNIWQMVGYKLTSPRKMMQTVGTELVRVHFGDNFWVDRLRDKIIYKTIIADVRMVNEIDLIREFDGTLILVEKDDIIKKDHISEQLNAREYCDVIIPNNGEKYQLYSEIEIWYSLIRKEKL